jgi:hypothetical protein
MNLWGATPLLVAALLGGAQHGLKPLAPAAASIAGSSVVLTQVDSSQWQTTLLLNSPVREKCPTRAEFALQTSARDKPYRPIERKGAPGQTPYCRRITLTFRGPQQIPVSAALVLHAPGPAISSVPASFSRPVGMSLYFAVPASAGLAMLFALALLAGIFVKVYDRSGARVRPLRTREGNARWNSEFWHWTVTASGAWTVSDSWATNISTVTAILATILSTSTAASTIFPGIALDRFALINVLAGGLIVAVPLVFAILYARWTARYPGPTTDTTIAPQVPLAKGDELIVAETVLVTSRATTKHQNLTSGTKITLRRKTFAIVTDGSPVSLAPADPGPVATLASGTVIAPVPGIRNDDEARAIAAHSPLAGNTKACLTEAAVLLPPCPPFRWMRIRSGQQAIITAELPGATPQAPTLRAGTRVNLPAGAVARFDTMPVTTGVSAVRRNATLPRGARVTVVRQADGTPAATKARIRGRCKIALTGPGQPGATVQAQQVLNQDPAIRAAEQRPVPVTAPGGATIALPGGAALGAIEYPGQWPLQVKDGTTIQVPPGSKIDVLTGSLITVPGGSDLLVGGETAIQINCQAGLIAVAASNVAPDPQAPPGPHAALGLVARMLAGGGHGRGQADKEEKPGPADIALPCPVFLTAPSGAKITVTGQADVELPAGLAMTAPRRKAYALGQPLHLTVPQPANALGASMRLVIVAALLTVFGVGAQLGIAGVLAYFSDASTTGRWTTFGLLGAVAVFLLYYSTTAIRSLADPQPGSSMSAAPGTSFTL